MTCGSPHCCPRTSCVHWDCRGVAEHACMFNDLCSFACGRCGAWFSRETHGDGVVTFRVIWESYEQYLGIRRRRGLNPGCDDGDPITRRFALVEVDDE